jgi:hypothetical protein
MGQKYFIGKGVDNCHGGYKMLGLHFLQLCRNAESFF